MAWDLALDLETGDFMFGPTRDLLGVTGSELDAQRISIRVRIPRGSFLYDADRTLGSNLYLVLRSASSHGIEDARSYLMEALNEMDGVSIDDVQIDVDDYGKMTAVVKFRQTGSLDDDDETAYLELDEQPVFDAIVTDVISEREGG